MSVNIIYKALCICNTANRDVTLQTQTLPLRNVMYAYLSKIHLIAENLQLESSWHRPINRAYSHVRNVFAVFLFRSFCRF